MQFVPAGLILAATIVAIVVAGVVAFLLAPDRASAFKVWRSLVLAILASALIVILAAYCRTPVR
jgi:hypothetical protein